VTPGLHEDEIVGKAYDWQLLRRLWPYLAPYRRLFGLSVLLSFPRVILGMAPGLLIAIGLNQLLAGSPDGGIAHGLGRLSDAEWLRRLATPPEGFDVLPWLAMLPGIVIFLTTMSISTLGDWLRDRLDATLKGV